MYVCVCVWGWGLKVVAEVRFDIGNMYKFHREKSVDVEVDVWRVDATKGKGVFGGFGVVSVERPMEGSGGGRGGGRRRGGRRRGRR